MIVLKIIGLLLLCVMALVLLILLLCCFSVRVHASYLKGEAAVSVHYLFLRFRLIPTEKKPAKKKKSKKEAAAAKEATLAQKEEKPSPKLLWKQYLPLLRTVRVTLRKLCKRLVIYKVEAGLDVGGEDAHKTALAYARVAAFAAVLMELLDGLFTFRRKYIRISPDFIHDCIAVNLSLRVRIRPIYVLAAGTRLFFAYIGTRSDEKPNRKHKRKGGQQYESAASHR